ncbi:MAG: hypothetical protein M1831_000659 [Alyxoria varia]|nr:MAG: hypothetical protein M1831_000659 [Alyxoria varia]
MTEEQNVERAVDDESNWEHASANPVNWPEWKKWRTTLIACFVTFIVGLNNTSAATIAPDIASEFGINDEQFQYTFFAITAWSVAAAIMPMLILPLMEGWGVRWIYIICYTLFTLSILPQALARNFHTLIITRFFAGAFGGVLQNAVDGIAANLWADPRKRAMPVSLYIFALVFGVTMGSVEGAIGGTRLGWRWTFWIELIIYAAFFPMVFLFIQECRGPVILRALLLATAKDQQGQKRSNEAATSPTSDDKKRKAIHLSSYPDAGTTAHLENSKEMQKQTTTLRQSLHEIRTVMTRSMYLLATEPPISLFTLWSAFSFGIVFLSTQSIALVFESTYGFSAYASGLAQASLAVGEVIAIIAQVGQNRVFVRSSSPSPSSSGGEEKSYPTSTTERRDPADTDGEDTTDPESHLYLSIPSSFLPLTGGLFLYAWTSYSPTSSPHWIIPCLGLALIGFGITSVVIAVSLYVTDGYASHAASAIAAVAFGENVLAGILPLAALRMYERLGYQWAGSLLGFASLALSFAPVLLVWRGKRIRARSKWAKGVGVGGGDGGDDGGGERGPRGP